MRNRAVITGIGLLTPLGNSGPTFFDAALKGRNAIGPIQKFDVATFPARIGGEIAFDERTLGIPAERLKDMPTIAKWGIAAARQAVADAGLNLKQEDPYGIDVIIGVTTPDFDMLGRQHTDIVAKGASAADPRSGILANPAAAGIQICIDLGLRGEMTNISTSCSSSANAIGYATRLIQHGQASCVLTGGVDECVVPYWLGIFGNSNALSKRNDDPARASRPFERSRDGYVLSDASCILVLEDYERARARGANIYCEVAGFGGSCDATTILNVSRSEESATRAVEKALRQASRGPEEIDYYCAHGTASWWTDIRETRTIKRVFREQAKKLAVSSIKSMMGHPLGAAGAIQTATAALAIRYSAIPPTINHEEPDPHCDLDYVPNEARSRRVRNALVYSLGMGGTNAALVLASA